MAQRMNKSRAVSHPLLSPARPKLNPQAYSFKHQVDLHPSVIYQPVSHDALWEAVPLKGTTQFNTLPNVKNILVTGGEGFMGSWMVRHLVLTYPSYNIVSFDKLDYCASRNNTRMLDVYTNFKFVKGDITNPEAVIKCLRAHDIDVVLHFAAQSHVDLSFGHPFTFTWDNIYGTHVLLDAARLLRAMEITEGKPPEVAGLKRFVYISTDEVYGQVEKWATDLPEHSKLNPTNPYAATKAAAENMVTAYSKSFGIPCIVARPNNVFGPNQYPEKVIPKFINLLNRGQKMVVHGDGTNSRRYIYAADVVDAFDTILHKGITGQVYNIGSQDEITNLELCLKLLSKSGKQLLEEWVEHTRDRPFNDSRYAIDSAKLHELGWRQQVSFEEGLSITFQWYSTFGDKWWGDISHLLTPFPAALKECSLAELYNAVSGKYT